MSIGKNWIPFIIYEPVFSGLITFLFSEKEKYNSISPALLKNRQMLGRGLIYISVVSGP